MHDDLDALDGDFIPDEDDDPTAAFIEDLDGLEDLDDLRAAGFEARPGRRSGL